MYFDGPFLSNIFFPFGKLHRRDCSTTYWTDRRFSPEVVAAVNEAVDQLKARAALR